MFYVLIVCTLYHPRRPPAIYDDVDKFFFRLVAGKRLIIRRYGTRACGI